MANVIDAAADLLYPAEGPTTLDIKFFCAGDANISATDLAEQVIESHMQITGNTAEEVENIDSHLLKQ